MQILYLTLFTATLALFGLWYATLFFYVNQLTAKYSIRTLSFLLKDFLTILFILIGLFAWFLSALGAFTLLNTYLLFPFYNIYIISLVLTPWFPIVLLITFFILSILFIVLTYRYSTYLNAQLLFDKVFNGIKPDELKLEEYKSFKKDVNELSKKGEINDPFSIVVDMSAKALLNHDLIAWRLIHNELVKLIDRWLKNEVLGQFETQKSIRMQSWDPYFYLSKLLVQHLSFMKEVVNKSGHPSLLSDVVSTSKHLANSFAIYGHNWKAVLEITSFMKKTGKELVEGDRIDELHPIFETLGELGKQSIKQKEQESFDEICRSFGWLGEHLVMKGIPVGPLMPNYDASGELDSLINCIDEIKNSLIKEKLDIFSQIYYEAIEAIALKFIEKGKEDQTFEMALISIISCIGKCGKEAAKWGVCSIVSHSVSWLKGIYENIKEAKRFKELPQSIVDWMTEIGALSACHNIPIRDPREASLLFFKPTTGEQDLIEVVIQKLEDINDEKLITNAIYNIYGKYSGEDCHKAVWEFITRTAKVCKSNFGFMFDWATGKIYAPDDPRRTQPFKSLRS